MSDKLKHGTLVEYNVQGLSGKGCIVGMALDDITQSYIIHPSESIKSDTYPYTHFICPVGHLKVVTVDTFKHQEDRKDSPHHYSNRLD